MGADEDYLFLKDQKKLDALGVMKDRRRAINKYEGMDTDRDSLNDAREVEVGIHNEQNRHIKRLGPSIGTAKVHSGGIQFDYDDSIISLKVKPTHSTVGGVYKMKSPKPMKLSVDFGDKHSHVTSKAGFNINMKSPKPHLHTLNTDGIKNMGLGKVESKKDKKDINDLAGRLTGFMSKQKKKTSGVSLTGASKLDFSHVGILPDLKKKKRGVL